MVEQVVAGRDRSKHLADGACRRRSVACALRGRPDYGFVGDVHVILLVGCSLGTQDFRLSLRVPRLINRKQFHFFLPQPPRESRLNSSTALITTLSGTSAAISTFPISRGRTKCTTPLCVFLSACRRPRILRALTLT